MNRMPRLGAALSCLLACAHAPPTPAARPSVASAASGEVPIGAPTPEFASLDATRWMNGAPTSLASLRGQVVLVESWHWLCDGCRESMPMVRALAQRFAARGLRVVSTHPAPPAPSAQEREAIDRAVHEEQMTYPCFLDPGSTWSRQMGLALRPAFLVVGRDGRVAYRAAAVMTAGEPDALALTAAVEGALAAPVP